MLTCTSSIDDLGGYAIKLIVVAHSECVGCIWIVSNAVELIDIHASSHTDSE